MLFKTLIHKGAMPVAVHAVRTFASVSGSSHTLEIHSDGSLEDFDFLQLERAAGGMPTQRVWPSQRQALLAPQIDNKPLSRALMSRPGYMTKLEVLAYEAGPFFYFDSDIVWLRLLDEPIASSSSQAIFSTETWSWYYGMKKPGVWITEKIPRRINSGFAYLPGEFPLARLEQMLSKGLYTPDHRFSTDQELLAYLYPNCRIFSLDDFARSRRGRHYDLTTMTSVALHFPGGMWKEHLAEIAAHAVDMQELPRKVRTQQAAPLTLIEILRMYGALECEQNYFLQRLAKYLRAMLRNRPQ